MTEPQINPAAVDVATPPASIDQLSLADYRAQREGRAAAPVAKDAEPSTEGPEPEENAATLDTAEPSDTPEAETPEAETEKAAKKKGGWQRKLDAKDREIQNLRAQLAAPKPAETAPEATPAPEPGFDKPKPKIADFSSLEEFTEALSDWKADERDFKRAQADAKAKAEQEAKQLQSDWNSRKAEAQKQHSDYDETLAGASEVMLTPAHQRLFLESEHGAELAYQLAKDQSELKKFAALSPLSAARYFGALEAKFAVDDAPKPETRTTSKAPAPIRPVGARATTSAAPPDLAKLPLSEYRRMRETGKLR